MAYENILYQTDDGIARITINRPQVLNAISVEVISELRSALEEAEADPAVLVVVLAGAGRAFSAGADISAPSKLESELKGLPTGLNLIDAIRAIPKAVIAMVHGYCLTGALEIALACDLIVASDDTKFGDTHARWGLVPRWGMTQLLPRTVGILKAKEMSFTANTLTAEEAVRIGLVTRVVPAGELDDTVRQLAKQIMSNSLDAVAAYKFLYNRGQLCSFQEGLELETTSQFVIRDRAERLGSRKQ